MVWKKFNGELFLHDIAKVSDVSKIINFTSNSQQNVWDFVIAWQKL